MNTFNPIQMSVDCGAVLLFDHIDGGGPMWAGSGKRWARAVVAFNQSFVTAPAVQLAIAMIDADTGKNLRLELSTEDLGPHGFTAVAHTWSDTRIGRLQVSWTAIGQGAAGVEPLWDV